MPAPEGGSDEPLSVDRNVGDSGFSLLQRPRRFHWPQVSPLKPQVAVRRQINYSALLRANREGSVMNLSPQDEWVRALLGRWFPNLHYALTRSREG